ncbi:RNHCP domain-containing protein [Nocardia sp. NPDC055321]
MSTISTSQQLNTFTCISCGLVVFAFAGDGVPRNHCPSCLHSRHVVDHVAGGHSECGARMSPLAIAVPRGGDWMLIHRCVRCDELAAAPICADDNQLVLMRIAVRPLAQPPFPLEAFGSL